MIRSIFYWVIMLSCLKIWAAGGICINQITLDYFSGDAFTRISEYFTGCENRNGDTIVRSNEDCREGMYFILHMNCAACKWGENGKIVLNYIKKGCPNVVQHIWDLESNNIGSTKDIYIGLTGSEWYNRTAELQAWNIEIQNKNGELISEYKSYLWSK